VTNKEGIPHAILVRGIHPTHGLDLILKRSGKPSITHRISDGPGKVSKILGIKTTHSGTDLLSNTIWLEDRKMIVSADEIEITRRIGIDYAGIDARRPYRFVYKQKNPGIAGAFMLY
jgi:DNA-3-methyladenine glycosylase